MGATGKTYRRDRRRLRDLQLAQLDRGKALPTSLPYRVATWTFGNELAMVFWPAKSSSITTCGCNRFRPASLVGHRVFQRCPVLHPLAARAERGRVRGRGGDGLLRPARPACRRRRKNHIIRAVHDLLPTVSRRRSLKEFPAAKSAEEALAPFQTRQMT